MKGFASTTHKAVGFDCCSTSYKVQVQPQHLQAKTQGYLTSKNRSIQLQQVVAQAAVFSDAELDAEINEDFIEILEEDQISSILSDDKFQNEDEILPKDTRECLEMAAESTELGFQVDKKKAMVEIQIKGYWNTATGPTFPDEGDQMKWWNMNKVFVRNLKEAGGYKKVRAIFPNFGSMALCKTKFPDMDDVWDLSCLEFKKTYDEKDECIVFCSPDPYRREKCLSAIHEIPEHIPQCLFQARLVNMDIGLFGGIAREMKQEISNSHLTTFFMRPVGKNGTLLRRYPRDYQFFVPDIEEPGRMKCLSEQPYHHELDEMMYQAFEYEEDVKYRKRPKIIRAGWNPDPNLTLRENYAEFYKDKREKLEAHEEETVFSQIADQINDFLDRAVPDWQTKMAERRKEKFTSEFKSAEEERLSVKKSQADEAKRLQDLEQKKALSRRR